MFVWNRPSRFSRGLLALALAGAALAAAAGVVWAHEGREVQGFNFDVGFLIEPAYEGQPNGVYLSVTRADEGGHHGAASGKAQDAESMARSEGHAHDGVVETADMSVEVTAEADPIDGINVRISPQGFVFAPESVNLADVDGEGHAHIYVNGEKVGRVYGERFHLTGVAPGEREIRVTLNANSHSAYAVDGQVVQAVTRISVPNLPPAPEEVGQVEAPAPMAVEISLSPDPLGVAYATDAAMLSGIGGIPSVVLGPGNIAQAHTNDEWIEIAQLEQAVGVYLGVCKAFGEIAA